MMMMVIDDWVLSRHSGKGEGGKSENGQLG